jgi:uncharacterized membrane protein
VTLEHVLLFLHIGGAFLIVAGAAMDTILGLRGAATTRTHTISTLADLELRALRMLLLPGAILAVVFGTWLVPVANYSFAGAWLSAAFLLWIVLMAVHGVLSRQVARVRTEAERLIAQGITESEELRTLVAAPRARTMRWAMDLMVVLFLYVMVFRPGA